MTKKIFLAASVSGLIVALPYLAPVLFPLAWIAFVPLFWAIDQTRGWRSALCVGLAAGTVAHLIGFYWLVYTISVFGEFPYAVSVIVFVVYALLQGIQLALFAVLVRTAGFGPLAIFPALFWVGLEFLFPLLFPWHLANSQISFLWFIQSADLVGPYGASFIIMWFSAALYRSALAHRQGAQGSWWPLAYPALLAVLTVLYGYLRLQSVDEEMAGARKLSLAAIQGNVDIDLKWNPALAQKNLDKHRALTANLESVPLVIWPESAIEFPIAEELATLPPEIVPALKLQRGRLIFGAKSFRRNPVTGTIQAFNTAFFADAQGNILARYHKQALLAFGEYLPFAKILSLLPGMPFADGFTPGPGPITFPLARNVRAAPLICYEDLMPELARAFVKETRANLLVNITNDAWYGRSVGPWQHARLAQWRAIETRRSLIRATNTGVTALINAKGEMVRSLPLFTDATMPAEVEILDGETFYVRFGDWFAWGATILSAAIVLLVAQRRFRH